MFLLLRPAGANIYDEGSESNFNNCRESNEALMASLRLPYKIRQYSTPLCATMAAAREDVNSQGLHEIAMEDAEVEKLGLNTV